MLRPKRLLSEPFFILDHLNNFIFTQYVEFNMVYPMKAKKSAGLPKAPKVEKKEVASKDAAGSKKKTLGLKKAEAPKVVIIHSNE